MKQYPDPEHLLRSFYADELRSATRGVRPIIGRSRCRGEHPLRTILVAAASLAIITGSALIARPVFSDVRGIPLMAAAFTDFAEASGLLEPFRAWAVQIGNKEDQNDA
ncbi:MAG: hypothetical protein ABIJ86_05660 [Spirochaetota bacterium]